jgi:GT2 family glycosyltransferase
LETLDKGSHYSDSDAISNLTAISVTCNSAHCVDNLKRSLLTVEHVVIVDNGSTDATIEQIQLALPHATVLINKKNIGFGAANNIALSTVRTDYALLINPDCIAYKEDIAALLSAAAEFPEAAIIAPTLIRRNGDIDVSYRWSRQFWKSKGPEATGACCVGFASGAIMLLNMRQMATIGFFDEDFFLYYEDEDLCERAFAQNKQIIVTPDIQVGHSNRGSVQGRRSLHFEFIRGYHHAQSKIFFNKKYNGIFNARKLHKQTLSLALIAILFRLLYPQPKYVARLLGRIFGLIQMKI